MLIKFVVITDYLMLRFRETGLLSYSETHALAMYTLYSWHVIMINIWGTILSASLKHLT